MWSEYKLSQEWSVSLESLQAFFEVKVCLGAGSINSASLDIQAAFFLHSTKYRNDVLNLDFEPVMFPLVDLHSTATVESWLYSCTFLSANWFIASYTVQINLFVCLWNKNDSFRT